jgi:hypothetical protein
LRTSHQATAKIRYERDRNEAISRPAANMTRTAQKKRRLTAKVITRNAKDASEAIAGNSSNIRLPRRVFIEPRLNASTK